MQVTMNTDRIEAFSDGVFAIAITLLILEIKVPQADNLAAGLLGLWPSYLAYAISFIVIGAIWINHHTMFDRIVRADHRLLLLNTAHLMLIAFLPFPTAVLAEALHQSEGQTTAAAFYGGTLTVVGLLVTAMWLHAANDPKLLSPLLTQSEAKRISCRYLMGPIGYLAATLLAFISHWISISIFVALNVYFLWPRRENSGTDQGLDSQ